MRQAEGIAMCLIAGYASGQGMPVLGGLFLFIGISLIHQNQQHQRPPHD